MLIEANLEAATRNSSQSQTSKERWLSNAAPEPSVLVEPKSCVCRTQDDRCQHGTDVPWRSLLKQKNKCKIGQPTYRRGQWTQIWLAQTKQWYTEASARKYVVNTVPIAIVSAQYGDIEALGEVVEDASAHGSEADDKVMPTRPT